MNVIFIIGLLAIFMFIAIKFKSIEQKNIEDKRNQSREDGERRLFARRVKDWRFRLQELESQFGTPTLQTAAYCNELKDSSKACNDIGVLVYPPDKLVIISSFPTAKILAEIPFGTVVDIEAGYMPIGIGTHVTETKTSILDMTAKAGIGALLFGSAGAIIGASAARRDSVTTEIPALKRYFINIILNSFETPALQFDFQTQRALWLQAVNALKVVLQTNNPNSQRDDVIIHHKNENHSDEQLMKTVLTQGHLSHFDVLRALSLDSAWDSELIFSNFMMKNKLDTDSAGNLVLANRN